ncbi:hypothetical protein KR054_000464 [Drosophila jambulina]|nr:hypothetical protein KR054_000464 [Drosophila jambulina]
MEISIKWRMCRTCRSERCSTLRSLFKSEAAKHLKQHVGLVVAQNDGLPDQICSNCFDKLEMFHRFIGMCRRSDEHLKSLVSKTMSSAASFKTTSATGGSPPVQKKRARKQKLSPQKNIFSSDDDSPRKLMKTEVKSENLVEEVETDEILPIDKSLPTEEEGREDNSLFAEEEDKIDKSLSAEEEGRIEHSIFGEEEDKIDKSLSAEEAEGRIDKSLSAEEESKIVFDHEYFIINPAENDCEATSSQGSPIAIHNGASSQEASEEEEECAQKVCNRRFNAACNLNAHMRTHTGEKPFQCAYCSRRFADHSSHRKHERIHTNERPYACHICGKTFALSTSLKAHYMTHTSEKPYKCEPCLKSFRLKHQLTAHEKTEAHRHGCAEVADMSS